jgi:hypothetical protein
MRCYSHLSDDHATIIFLSARKSVREHGREQIGLAEALGHTIGVIAQAIGRPKSTVWRELSRDRLPSGRAVPPFQPPHSSAVGAPRAECARRIGPRCPARVVGRHRGWHGRPTDDPNDGPLLSDALYLTSQSLRPRFGKQYFRTSSIEGGCVKDALIKLAQVTAMILAIVLALSVLVQAYLAGAIHVLCAAQKSASTAAAAHRASRKRTCRGA